MRRFVFADDLFQLSKVPLQKTVHVVEKAIENLSGCKFHDRSQIFPADTFSSNGLKIHFWVIMIFGNKKSYKMSL